MNRTLLAILFAVPSAVPFAVAQEKPDPNAGVPKAERVVEVKTTTLPGPAPIPGKGNDWFPVTDQDLGTFLTHEHATGKFAFKNPNGQPVQWKAFKPSCQCAKVVMLFGTQPGDDGQVNVRRYEYSDKPRPNQLVRITRDEQGKEQQETVTQIEVGPHEAGELEVHREMNGVSGPRTANFVIHTTDPAFPMLTLNWKANGAQMFVMSPAEVNLNTMSWSETREFTVSVTSPLQKDFNITRMDDAGPDFKVSYEKSMNGDSATWTIRGTYGPIKNETGSGGVLKLYTDLQGNPSMLLRVSAMVQGPLEVKPGSFITLGMIRQGNSKAEKVEFVANDGSDLDTTDISFEKLSVDPKFVTSKTVKDGKKVVVELLISSDAPRGLLRGDMVVKLNHPAVKEKRILFNGFVR
jgi:hypothetical protein